METGYGTMWAMSVSYARLPRSAKYSPTMKLAILTVISTFFLGVCTTYADQEAKIAGLICGLVNIAAVVLAIRATIVSARTFRGALALLWILLCWLLPVIGPIAALVAARRQVQLEEHPIAEQALRGNCR